MGVKMIMIPQEEYDKLQESDDFLEALRAAGVDNWSGYSDAKDIMEEWKSENEEAS